MEQYLVVWWDSKGFALSSELFGSSKGMAYRRFSEVLSGSWRNLDGTKTITLYRLVNQGFQEVDKCDCN